LRLEIDPTYLWSIFLTSEHVLVLPVMLHGFILDRDVTRLSRRTYEPSPETPFHSSQTFFPHLQAPPHPLSFAAHSVDWLNKHRLPRRQPYRSPDRDARARGYSPRPHTSTWQSFPKRDCSRSTPLPLHMLPLANLKPGIEYIFRTSWTSPSSCRASDVSYSVKRMVERL
jgi:hypothetical protein